MSQSITITAEDILHQVKLSLQIPDIVQGIIRRKIIVDAASEAELTVEAEELQKAADTIRFLQNLHSAEETFAWLKKQGLSIENFEEATYLSVISQKLAVHLFADQVESYFNEHQLNYTGIVLYEIILEDEDLALKLFNAVREKRMSFHHIAHQYIQDKELRRQGGYRGLLSPKDLIPEIANAVLSAKPPQMMKPIVTSQGIHLIFVEEIIEAELDSKLRSQIILELFNRWIQKQVESVTVISDLEN